MVGRGTGRRAQFEAARKRDADRAARNRELLPFARQAGLNPKSPRSMQNLYRNSRVIGLFNKAQAEKAAVAKAQQTRAEVENQNRTVQTASNRSTTIADDRETASKTLGGTTGRRKRASSILVGPSRGGTRSLG